MPFYRAYALVAALVLAGPASASAATSGEPFHIDVILSQSGAAAFLGTTETKALAVLEKVVNANGGIRGQAWRSSQMRPAENGT